MKNIKILGPGCNRCKQLESAVREAVKEMGIDADIEKIEDYERIMAYDILSTPALVVDGHVRLSGKVPTPVELRPLLA